MNIAVIGAGIYGCTIALRLAEHGFDVDIIERESDILNGATFISRRSHLGYFYPRSTEMLASCQKDTPQFEQHYPKAIIKENATYYAIAKRESKITGARFLSTLDDHRLPYKLTSHPLLSPKSVELCVEVKEHYYDPSKLREEVKDRLKNSSVNVLLNTDATNLPLEQYDLKIVATYGHNNAVISALDGCRKQQYEYRLCEKVVVELPEAFNSTSFVVMDGPFFQLEPFGTEKGKCIISHLVHSIHDAHIGNTFTISPERAALLAPDSVVHREGTRFSHIIDAVSEFIPEITKARYVSSIYAVKPVRTNELGDAKSVVVQVGRADVLTVLAGKVSGSMRAATECLEYAKKLKERYAARDSKSRTASTAV